MSISHTMKFSKEANDEYQIREVLSKVHEALKAKEYDPINQMVGYLISGDPTYITSKDNARQMITQIDRDEILEVLLKYFLYDDKE